MNRVGAAVLALLVVTSAVGVAFGASAGATSTNGAESNANGAAGSEAYAGSHVAFSVEGDSITDYRVGGEETFSSVAVQSKSEAAAGADVGAEIELEALTAIDGAGLSVNAQTETRAEVRAESGATLSAHDTDRGTLVVESGGEEQVVTADLAAGAAAETEGDRVRVETGDREGVFLVAGDGEVTVNGEGDVAAELGTESTLVFRAYEDGERDETAAYEESLIADGTAAAEVHVEERDGEPVGEAATYGQETSAEVATEAENRVDVTIDRAVHEGAVVMTTVSEAAVGSLEDLEVRVDGEVAAEASSQSELEGAIGGDESRYVVAQQAEASGEATVYIAFNHFSERTATIEGQESDGANGDSGTDDETGDGEQSSETEASDENDGDAGGDDPGSDDGDGDSVPGFGVAVAVVAIAVAGLLARVRD